MHMEVCQQNVLFMSKTWIYYHLQSLVMSHGSHIMIQNLNSNQMFGIRKAHLLLLNKRYNSCRVLAFSTIFFPFKAVLGLFRPLKEFHPSQVIPNIIIPSVFRSSYWSSYIWLPFIYFPYNTCFRFSMYMSKPAQSLGFDIVYYI